MCYFSLAACPVCCAKCWASCQAGYASHLLVGPLRRCAWLACDSHSRQTNFFAFRARLRQRRNCPWSPLSPFGPRSPLSPCGPLAPCGPRFPPLKFSLLGTFAGKKADVTGHPKMFDHLGELFNVIHDLILAYLRDANICRRATGSTGLTMWALKPASRERLRSSSCPQPVTATRTMSLPHGCSRIRRAAS